MPSGGRHNNTRDSFGGFGGMCPLKLSWLNEYELYLLLSSKLHCFKNPSINEAYSLCCSYIPVVYLGGPFLFSFLIVLSMIQMCLCRWPVSSSGRVIGVCHLHRRIVCFFVFSSQDIIKSECRSNIKKVLNNHGHVAFDLVLHDGSPNVGGAWAQEAMSQNALVIDFVKLAAQFLAPKGNFVTKVIIFFLFFLELLNWVLGFYVLCGNRVALFSVSYNQPIGFWVVTRLFTCTTHYLCNTLFSCSSLIGLIFKTTLLICITHFNIQRIIHNSNNVYFFFLGCF